MLKPLPNPRQSECRVGSIAAASSMKINGVPGCSAWASNASGTQRTAWSNPRHQHVAKTASIPATGMTSTGSRIHGVHMPWPQFAWESSNTMAASTRLMARPMANASSTCAAMSIAISRDWFRVCDSGLCMGGSCLVGESMFLTVIGCAKAGTAQVAIRQKR